MLKQGDLVSDGYSTGYFVCLQKGSEGSAIIEMINNKGWERKYNPSFIPEDYVHLKGDSYWAVTTACLKLVEPAANHYEIY